MRTSAIALAAACATVLLSACSSKPPAQGPPKLVVDVGHAQRKDLATFVTLDAQIAPLQQSTLSLAQSGTLVSVNVNEGDRVHTGEVLAKIDDSTLRAQLSQAQAQVVQAQASLSSSGYSLPITTQQMSSNVITAEQQLLQAQNALQSAVAALNTARIQYNSNKQLSDQGYLAKTTLDQSYSTYVAAQQTVNSDRNGVALAQAAVAAAKKNTLNVNVAGEDINNKRGALAAAQANVRLLQAQIAQTTLYAPYEGVVTQRLLDPGAFAGPNQAILQVSQIDHVYVNANVPDEDLGFVRPGTPATFTSASLPGRTFHGVIATVNATPTSGTLSYRARIRQPNPDYSLRGGMLVALQVRKEFVANATVVPRTAVFAGDQGANVYTIADGKAKAIPVTVGIQTDTEAQVTGSGLAPGTTVITTRPDALQDGSLVAVAGPPPGAAPAAPTGAKK